MKPRCAPVRNKTMSAAALGATASLVPCARFPSYSVGWEGVWRVISVGKGGARAICPYSVPLDICQSVKMDPMGAPKLLK